jgi:hypothetical protein
MVGCWRNLANGAHEITHSTPSDPESWLLSLKGWSKKHSLSIRNQQNSIEKPSLNSHVLLEGRASAYFILDRHHAYCPEFTCYKPAVVPTLLVRALADDFLKTIGSYPLATDKSPPPQLLPLISYTLRNQFHPGDLPICKNFQRKKCMD